MFDLNNLLEPLVCIPLGLVGVGVTVAYWWWRRPPPEEPPVLVPINAPAVDGVGALRNRLRFLDDNITSLQKSSLALREELRVLNLRQDTYRASNQWSQGEIERLRDIAQDFRDHVIERVAYPDDQSIATFGYFWNAVGETHEQITAIAERYFAAGVTERREMLIFFKLGFATLEEKIDALQKQQHVLTIESQQMIEEIAEVLRKQSLQQTAFIAALNERDSILQALKHLEVPPVEVLPPLVEVSPVTPITGLLP